MGDHRAAGTRALPVIGDLEPDAIADPRPRDVARAVAQDMRPTPVDFDAQSRRLHEVIKHSALRRIADCGHMVHQTATSDVLAAIAQIRTRIAG